MWIGLNNTHCIMDNNTVFSIEICYNQNNWYWYMYYSNSRVINTYNLLLSFYKILTAVIISISRADVTDT